MSEPVAQAAYRLGEAVEGGQLLHHLTAMTPTTETSSP